MAILSGMHARFLLCLLTLMLTGSVQGAKDTSYVESMESERPIQLLGPRKDAPAEQLAYALKTEEKGKLRAACRRYEALINRWPDAMEAATAQHRLAQCLQKRGKDKAAFEAYEELLKTHPQRAPYDQVLTSMFDIASRVMDERKMAWFGLPGFQSPAHAVPYFQSILKYGPHWERAPEAQYLIGRAYEIEEQYADAAPAYEAVQFRYPDSARAEAAACRRARCLAALSDRSPNNERSLLDAWTAVVLFEQHFPNSDFSPTIEALRDRLLRRRTEHAWEKAQFYDRIARRPTAAKKAYEQFVREFPGSVWTPSAQKRIEELSEQQESKREDEN